MRVCHGCHQPLPSEGKVVRSDLCPHCSRPIHCCLNCGFFDEHAHNHCRETQAEWVADRTKANFCDYFVVRDSPNSTAQADPAEAARARLKELFGK